MRKLWLVAIFGLFVSCKGLEGDFKRQIVSFDLNDPANKPFTLTSQHLSVLLLDGMLSNDLQPEFVQYEPEYKVEKATKDSVITRLIHDFGEYYVESELEYAALGLDASLVGLDEWELTDENGNKARRGNYFHLFYPAEFSSEGLEYYITSFEYDAVLKFLDEKKSSPLWFEYYVEKWGWLTQDIRMQDYTDAQRQALDIIDVVLDDTAQAVERDLRKIRQNQPERLITGSYYESAANPLKMTLYVVSEFGDIRTGLLDYQTAAPVAESKNLLKEDPQVLTYNQAIINRNFKQNYQPQLVSDNDEMVSLDEKDPTFKKLKAADFKMQDTADTGNEIYEFIVVENLNWENQELISEIFDAVSSGRLNGFKDDLLIQQMADSAFFNRWIIPSVFDEDDIELYKPEQVKRFQLIRKFSLNSDLSFKSHEVIGLGLFIPALYTEIGLNHLLGYFKLEDVKKIQESEFVDFNLLSGIPFKKYPLRRVDSRRVVP